MRHRLRSPAGHSTVLVSLSAIRFLLGSVVAAAAGLGCARFVGGCPTAWIQPLHPLLRVVRFATVPAVLVGLAFFVLSGAMAMRRQR